MASVSTSLVFSNALIWNTSGAGFSFITLEWDQGSYSLATAISMLKKSGQCHSVSGDQLGLSRGNARGVNYIRGDEPRMKEKKKNLETVFDLLCLWCFSGHLP